MLRIRSIVFVITLLLVVWASLPVRAQDTTNTIGRVTIASPTAASLGKYGDIPVSYHTGLPQISVPIYTVQSGSLKLPISLSYHASGLKVQEPAGWAGAGWALNAGGMISRTVMGAPDDRGFSTSNVLFGHYTDLGFNSYLNVGQAGYGGTPDDLNFARGVKDGEPDLYFFNFGGYSGKFYFNDDRTPVIVPEADFRIQPFVQSGQGFIGFIVTTPDGTKYYFGQAGNNDSIAPIEATNPFTLQNGPANTTAAASAWYLNKIVSVDGVDSITFSYQQENYSYYTLATFPVLGSNYNQQAADYSMQNGMNLVKNLVAGVRLSQISYANGVVYFEPAATPRQDLSYSAGLLVSNSMADDSNRQAYSLGCITISNFNGFCQKDSLYQSYFYDNTALPSNFYSGYSLYNLHSDQYRLRLDSIRQTSCDGSTPLPPYKFTYFSEKVPRMLSFGMDHWGYPNGADTNSTLMPQLVKYVGGSPIVIGGSFRDAVWPAIRGGSLQQITYPTGGTTQFAFEPKSIYTFTNSTLQPVQLQDYFVGGYGQSNTSQTLNFTVSGTGGITITINNPDTGWSPSFTIKDAGGTLQAGTPWSVGVRSSLTENITLPPGTYTGTLAYPPTANSLSYGSSAFVDQYQYVASTRTLTVGGLRIQTITHSDGLTSTPIVTSYTYPVGSGNTGGTLYSIPVYIQVLRSDLNKLVWGELPSNQYCSPNGCWSCDGYNEHQYYLSPGSVQPMNSLQGENMGYDEVDVTQTGNGKSVYRYYGSNLYGSTLTDVCQRQITQSSVCDASIPSFPYPPVPFEFMRDELQYEGHFNDSGHVLKEKYYFPAYVGGPVVTPGHISVNLPYIYTYTEYMRQSAKKIKDSVVTNQYDPATGAVLTGTDVVYYSSPYHRQPTRQVTTTSTGDSLATNTTYALDLRVSGCDGAIPDSTGYYTSMATSDTSWLNSNINSCTPQVNNTNNCRLSSLTSFREMLMRDRVKFLIYRRRSFATDTASLLRSCYLTAEAGADALLKPILRLQDEYKNMPVEVSQWRNQRLIHAAFTRYDTSTAPIGFAYPGETQLINLATPGGSFSPLTVSGSSLTRDSRYVDETAYSFANGHPQQVTGRDGITTSYIWDYGNSELIARVVNAAASDVAYTSFESGGRGGWSVALPYNNVGSITGKYYYDLQYGGLSRDGLDPTKTYIVSYWSYSDNPATVSGTISITPGKVSPQGWQYYEHTVTGVSTVAVVSGSGENIAGPIDELRLYPATAQMITYTHSPGVGITSQCDVNNRVTNYTYDALGRLLYIQDQDGNFIKTFDYHYANQ